MDFGWCLCGFGAVIYEFGAEECGFGVDVYGFRVVLMWISGGAYVDFGWMNVGLEWRNMDKGYFFRGKGWVKCWYFIEMH